MKKRSLLAIGFAFIVMFAMTTSFKVSAKTNSDGKIVVGSYVDDGFCDPGGIECAYEELPPVILSRVF